MKHKDYEGRPFVFTTKDMFEHVILRYLTVSLTLFVLSATFCYINGGINIIIIIHSVLSALFAFAAIIKNNRKKKYLHYVTLKIDENGILIWPDDNFNDSVKKSFTPWNQVKKITFGARQKGGDIYYSLRIIKRSKKFVFFYLNDYVYFYTYRLKKAIRYFSGRKDIC